MECPRPLGNERSSSGIAKEISIKIHVSRCFKIKREDERACG
jgi:hypothetical protein